MKDWCLGRGAEVEATASELDGSRDQRALVAVRRYLTCGSLVWHTFKIEERRPVFWWCLQHLLNVEGQPHHMEGGYVPAESSAPGKDTNYGDLRYFLTKIARRGYSDHIIKATLLKAQSDGFFTLSPPPDADGYKITSKTLIKLGPTLFSALKMYGDEFRKEFGQGRSISIDDATLYKRVNAFLRHDYAPRWDLLTARIAEQGSLRGRRSKEFIEDNLKNYTNSWAVINFVWAETLTSRVKNEDSYRTREQIYRDINKITAVRQVDLDKIIPFLREDVGFVEMRRTNGKPTYGLTAVFEPHLRAFTEETGPQIDALLSEIFSS